MSDVRVSGADDADSQQRRASAVDELEQGVQVEPAICGQPLRGLGREAGFEQAADAPALDVERGSVATASAAQVWEVVHGHVLLVSLGTGGLTCLSTTPGKNRSRRDTNKP